MTEPTRREATLPASPQGPAVSIGRIVARRPVRKYNRQRCLSVGRVFSPYGRRPEGEPGLSVFSRSDLGYFSNERARQRKWDREAPLACRMREREVPSRFRFS